jgi:hypothetical protein
MPGRVNPCRLAETHGAAHTSRSVAGLLPIRYKGCSEQATPRSGEEIRASRVFAGGIDAEPADEEAAS